MSKMMDEKLIRKYVIRIQIFLFFVSVYSYAQIKDENHTSLYKAMHSITSIECLEHVKKLASDEFEGRAPGSVGFDLAAHYVAEQFKDMKLLPAVKDSTYFQNFPITRNVIGAEQSFALEVILPVSKKLNDTLTVAYTLEEDYLPTGSAAPCDMIKEVVFAGYGINSPENKWNDYKHIDAKDKIVMILEGTPQLEEADWGQLFRSRNKINFAEKAGAAGFIIIGHPVGTISTSQSLPAIRISEKVANDLLKGTGYTIELLKQKMNQQKKSLSFNLPHRVRMKIQSNFQTNLPTMNVIGYVKGCDPVLQHEYIVVGAHVDHVGSFGNYTFYGANDNASGTATMMEVAEAFTQIDSLVKRSIVFIAFTGEEMGLLGSKYYVENPVFPIENTKAMINLDMVGSGDDAIMIVGAETYPEFARLFDDYSDEYIHIPIKHRWTAPNSDHYSFYDAGVPAVFLYVMNGVPTYHSTRDKAETLNPETMETVGRLVFWVVWNLANKDEISFKLVEQAK